MRASLRLALLPFALLASVASAAGHAHYDVTVGLGGLKFDPEIIPTAHKGDTITYHFYAKNHSVVQSSFDDPCHPLAGGNAIFSAFVPQPEENVESPTTFTITVQDEKPLWFYCSQTNGAHCQKGMVHSINAPTTGNTHQVYKEKAAIASNSTSPSSDIPGGIPNGGVRQVNVTVAPGGDLKFVPNNIVAPPKTVVQFSFNPANHSVVQSSFREPCQPLQDGFSSGFIPTKVTPSGVLFNVEVKDTKPVWFYCAQTTKTHCQAGMVGSFNAPTQGDNTLEAFIALAATAPPSTLPPNAPLGGVITANGTPIATFNGNVLNLQTLDKGVIDHVPKPGENISDTIWNLAGGNQPLSYNWSPSLTGPGAEYLQFLLVLENLILEVLWDGFDKLKRRGAWSGLYPHSIVSTIGTMAAQALVHRSSTTDSLQHYSQTIPQPCTYKYPADNLDAWLATVHSLLVAKSAVCTDIITILSASDPWIVPVLATQIGSTSRMAAVVNMMQNHKASAAPREALLPSRLAYSYVMENYVTSCPTPLGGTTIGAQAVLPPLVFTEKKTLGSDSVTAVTVALPKDAPENVWIAWIGAWGSLTFTPVRKTDGFSTVPAGMYGYLWAVLVTQQNVKLQEVASVAIAGPEPIWVADPTWSDGSN